jgi:hypothetical protein
MVALRARCENRVNKVMQFSQTTVNHPKFLNLVLPTSPETRPTVEEQECLFETRVNVNITYQEVDSKYSTAQGC